MKNKSADKIFINQLIVPAMIGVFPEEHEAPQNLSIDIELSFDIRSAAVNDDLNKTIDYTSVRRVIIEFISRTNYELLETLGNRLVRHLREYFNFTAIFLRITKKPFDMPDVAGVGIIIERDFASQDFDETLAAKSQEPYLIK